MAVLYFLAGFSGSAVLVLWWGLGWFSARRGWSLRRAS